MLPAIQNDIAYLDRNHLEVRDLNYKKLNPFKINWYDIDTVHFPFYIRQSTGCDNSLGIIKLDFDNPYGIYLHDTPQKELFALNNRFFSHGCMRMEKPIEMAKYLLKNNKAALDSIDFEKDCIIVDYIIVYHPNYINNLLNKNYHKNHKPLLKYILRKNPELITDINKYNKIIVAESFFVNNEINFTFVDHLLQNNTKYIDLVNEYLNNKHEKYNDLVRYI
jgi:hypothetical protein